EVRGGHPVLGQDLGKGQLDLELAADERVFGDVRLEPGEEGGIGAVVAGIERTRHVGQSQFSHASPPCRSVYVPTQLVCDVDADDVVERTLAREAEGQSAARVETARPAGDDARDHRVGFAANAR